MFENLFPVHKKEARLNELALLFVHRDLNINFEYVIDKFSCKNRKINFNSVKFRHTEPVNFLGSPITVTNQFVSVNALNAVL